MNTDRSCIYVFLHWYRVSTLETKTHSWWREGFHSLFKIVIGHTRAQNKYICALCGLPIAGSLLPLIGGKYIVKVFYFNRSFSLEQYSIARLKGFVKRCSGIPMCYTMFVLLTLFDNLRFSLVSHYRT